MKKLFNLLSICLFTSLLNAQVGINTENPKAMLDVNGNLIVRTVNSATTFTNDHTILIRDKSISGDNEIKEISRDDLFSTTNSSIYYATKIGSWSLLALGIGGSWYKINLTGTSDTKLGDEALFINGVYTAPQTGIYTVNYEFQWESGINLELLGGKKLGLLKNNTIWEEKNFDAVRVSLLGITIAAVPVTSSGIHSLVALNAGETLTFAINTDGALPVNLGLLTTAKVNLTIYKISN